MGTPNTGKLAKIAFDSALPFDASSKGFEYNSNSLAKNGVILRTEGMRGTRQNIVERSRTGPYAVSGQLAFVASPSILDWLLPYILGGAEAIDVFDLAESLSSFYIMEDKGAKLFTWAGCVISRFTFRGSQGQLVQCVADIEATSETVAAAGGFPSLTLPTDSPWTFSDGVLTLQGQAREFSEFELVIDNLLATDRWQNSLTRASFPSSGLAVTLRTNHPWTTSEVDLYGQALAGAAGSIVFTNADVAGNVLTIALGALQVPDRTPQTGGPGEIRLGLEMEAVKSGSSPAIRITNLNTYD